MALMRAPNGQVSDVPDSLVAHYESKGATVVESSEGLAARAESNRAQADKFGEATTHWRKLMERVERRVGHPCPLLLIGIPAGVDSDTAA